MDIEKNIYSYTGIYTYIFIQIRIDYKVYLSSVLDISRPNEFQMLKKYYWMNATNMLIQLSTNHVNFIVKYYKMKELTWNANMEGH